MPQETLAQYLRREMGRYWPNATSINVAIHPDTELIDIIVRRLSGDNIETTVYSMDGVNDGWFEFIGDDNPKNCITIPEQPEEDNIP